MTTYADFLADKIAFDRHYGQPVTDEQINPLLKPHQRRIVQWAVEGGRRAIFAAFGLGMAIKLAHSLGVRERKAQEAAAMEAIRKDASA